MIQNEWITRAGAGSALARSTAQSGFAGTNGKNLPLRDIWSAAEFGSRAEGATTCAQTLASLMGVGGRVSWVVSH